MVIASVRDDDDMAELEAELLERLRIDPMALDREFIRCPGNIAILGARHGAALRAYLRAKIRSKKLWGLLLIQAREDLEASQDEAQARENDAAVKASRKPKDVRERITVSTIDAHAQQMPAWISAQEEEIDAEVAMTVAKTNLSAMLAKKDMLVQMGANMRAEMERDPVIRNDRAASRNQDDG